MTRSTLLVSIPSALLLLAIAAATGCGGSKPRSGPVTCTGDCMCMDTECSCRAGGTCTFGFPAVPDGGSSGGTDAAPATSTAPPDNVTYNCGAQNECNTTCGTGCTSTCAARSACTGTCTSDCTSTCSGTSQCTLETGVNSDVACEGGSTCTVKLDTGSRLTCRGDSKCTIDCPKGGCTAECGGSASCTVKCGGTTACKMECNGTRMQDCPAGMTCNGVCPGGQGGGDAGPPRDMGR